MLLVQLEIPLDDGRRGVRSAAASRRRGSCSTSAPYADLPADVLALADPVVANEHEARAARRDLGPAVIAAGDPRCDGVDWDGLRLLGRRACRTEEVVDTTGAGDAFCGALAAALAAGPRTDEAGADAARSPPAPTPCATRGAQPDG